MADYWAEVDEILDECFPGFKQQMDEQDQDKKQQQDNQDNKKQDQDQDKKQQQRQDKQERPKGYTAADLQKMVFPEPKWAVPGILPEGLNILAGKPKMGKSILALNIGLAIATGSKALSSVDVAAGTVLYFALEDTPRRLQSRIETMIPAARFWPERLICYNDWPKMGEGGISAMQAAISEHEGVRLVIIDTLKMFRPVAKAGRNQYDVDYEPVNRIKKEISDKHGVSTLLIHHLNKSDAADIMDQFSGSFGLTGAADGLIALARMTGRGDAVLHGNGRDFEPYELGLEFQPDYLSWALLGDVAEVMKTKKQQAVFDAIKDAVEPISPKEIAEIIGNDQLGYIKSKALPALMRMGKIRKVGRGKYEASVIVKGEI
jgi:hypothetical protein